MLLHKWEQVYPIVYHAILRQDEATIPEEYDFILKGAPFDIMPLVDNMKMIMRDHRFSWPTSHVPLHILRAIPVDRRWISILLIPYLSANAREAARHIQSDNSIRGMVDKLSLPLAHETASMGSWAYMDMNPQLVLGFDDYEDFVYFRLKHV